MEEENECCDRCKPNKDKLCQVFWGYEDICVFCGVSIKKKQEDD